MLQLTILQILNKVFYFFLFLEMNKPNQWSKTGLQIILFSQLNYLLEFKGTVSQYFRYFFLQKTLPESHMKRQNSFRKYFVFRYSEKTCVREIIDYV